MVSMNGAKLLSFIPDFFLIRLAGNSIYCG
jgi:hypothetical protein